MTKLFCFFSSLLSCKKKGSRRCFDGNKMKKHSAPTWNGAMVIPLNVVVPIGSLGRDTTADNVEVTMDDDKAVGTHRVAEAAYEGGKEHDKILPMRRDFSNSDLRAQASKTEACLIVPETIISDSTETESRRSEGNKFTAEVMIRNGCVSDPEMQQAPAFGGSLRLKRSCSNIETRIAVQLLTSPPYDGALQILSGNSRGEAFSHGFHISPLPAMSPCSTERVMLSKRSLSQVLPSKSRKLWWKLLLHMSGSSNPRTAACIVDSSNQQSGYTSDTLESKNNEANDKRPQNQWVELSAESSSSDRVRAWINDLNDNLVGPFSEKDEGYEQITQPIISPSSPNTGKSPGRNQAPVSWHPIEEVFQAISIIKPLNSTPSVAHISGMALKAIPVISVFSSLRFVNLSKNFIVNIPSGALPRSLHTLDLSRNRIVTIEGLKDLIHLRVLNLSYNRISRVEHGLSKCTLIKELYLAGNTISDAEGLHRLLKLSVLDLSFNKIATTRSLGQLVANYKSLLALNLLGNPIQNNVGGDQLRKAVIGLLPQLTYLNKQPIKPQRTREAFSSSIAKAALGDSRWNLQRRPGKQVSPLSGSSIKGRAEDREQSAGSGHRSSRNGRRNRKQQRSGGK